MASARRNLLFYGGAVAVHLLVVALLPHARYEPIGKHEGEPVVVSIDDLLKASTTTETTTGTGARTIARTGTSRTSRARSADTSTSTAAGTESSQATDLGSSSSTNPASSGSLFITPDAIGLAGSGSYTMEVARQEPTENERIAENVNRAIMDPIRAHELGNGSLTSGPVAQELERSTRGDSGSPFEGRAVFSISVDDVGLVVSVGVAESSGDRKAWDDVANRVLNALAQRRVHMPPGAKGVAMRIEVTSKVTLPSGARAPVTSHGPDTTSIVGGTFDLSDIGAHPQRVVGARVLSENVY